MRGSRTSKIKKTWQIKNLMFKIMKSRFYYTNPKRENPIKPLSPLFKYNFTVKLPKMAIITLVIFAYPPPSPTINVQFSGDLGTPQLLNASFENAGATHVLPELQSSDFMGTEFVKASSALHRQFYFRLINITLG